MIKKEYLDCVGRLIKIEHLDESGQVLHIDVFDIVKGYRQLGSVQYYRDNIRYMAEYFNDAGHCYCTALFDANGRLYKQKYYNSDAELAITQHFENGELIEIEEI